nr:hypothetical protein [Streptomyces griseolus]
MENFIRTTPRVTYVADDPRWTLSARDRLARVQPRRIPEQGFELVVVKELLGHAHIGATATTYDHRHRTLTSPQVPPSSRAQAPPVAPDVHSIAGATSALTAANTMS